MSFLKLIILTIILCSLFFGTSYFSNSLEKSSIFQYAGGGGDPTPNPPEPPPPPPPDLV